MFRILKIQTDVEGAKYIEAACNANDTKPEENIMQGSLCVETDTGKVYFFDEAQADGSKWVEQFTFQPEE